MGAGSRSLLSGGCLDFAMPCETRTSRLSVDFRAISGNSLMCGIAGIVGGIVDVDSGREKLLRMLKTMCHQGPDDSGEYLEKDTALSLGHRRLSIIDPEGGHQTMVSRCGRFVVVYNGAIYNYLELRRDLLSRGYAICSYSDTEVLLYGYQEWGPECLQRFLGMFAFAI